MKTKFAISSHRKFSDKTYPVIVDSMLKCGVPAEDIYFFIGGHDKYEEVKFPDANVWKVDHNSIDFTGLISVLDLGIKSDRWFLLHDTLYVGENFYKCINNKITDRDVVDMSRLWSKNMGSYSEDYLQKISNELINNFKNKSNTDEDALKYKLFNIKTENIFLKQEDVYTTQLPTIVSDQVDFYDSGTMRSVQFYPDIDIYKVQTFQDGNHIKNISI